MKKIINLLASCTLLVGCTNQYESNNIEKNQMETSRINDIHSYADFNNAYTTHIFLDLVADFDTKTLTGMAAHTIENNKANEIIFDTKDLNITKVVTDDKGGEVDFTVGKEDEFKGSPLTVSITPNTTRVEIYYSTNPSSEAVQWLSPQQTADKTHPFLFTQGEAILTRSWIPNQDSPGNKITYSARIKVPDSLTAVMSANTTKADNGVFEFEMKQPIPSYLIDTGIQALFSVKQQGKEDKFLMQVEMTASHLLMSGMTVEGLSLFSLDWNTSLNTITYDKKIAIEPLRVLAELQLVLWSVDDISHGLKQAKMIRISQNQRELMSETDVIYKINQRGNVSKLVNLKQNYSIKIEELDRWQLTDETLHSNSTTPKSVPNTLEDSQ